ncbi:hypothetical protein [Lacihabitans soyangensis]|uniref:Uncharacterized protein n=1 Tax=Lacihabitans soyangensis TaxID=869394 RepID=A0AAE3H6W1_9BACT|nr:hypothetical protein [Lacihabitans soyangensis]MCP9765146.1 hypothetical protein [Lacihabitans soyangensis]
MPTSIKLSDISAELQDVATDKKDHFFTEVYNLGENDSDPENSIPSMADYCAEFDTPNEVIFTNVWATGAWQPGGKKTATGKVFNPTPDAVVLKPKSARVEHISQNFEWSQADLILLKKSYLNAIQRKAIKADEIPFGQFLLDELALMAKEELRLAYWMAVHNPQGTNFLQLFNGYRHQLLAAITSGEIPASNVVDTAVLSATSGVNVFETIVAGIPTKMLSKVVCLVSRTAKKAYEDDYRTRYGTLPYNLGQKKPKIDGTSIEFMVEPGLDGFNRPIFTTRKNLARLYDSSSMAELEIVRDIKERSIAAVVDAQAGAGFGNGKHVWTNDGV